MTPNKAQFTALLFMVSTSLSAYAQFSLSGTTRVANKVAGPPTASNLAYPQSLFVDSQNGNIWVADFSNNRVLRFDVVSLTNVGESTVPLTAEDYQLSQNYPNPFNPGTIITFAMRKTEQAAVRIYNVLGQEVATLFDGIANANQVYSLSFNATNLTSGLYFYTLRSASRNEVKKMSVVK